MTLSGSNSAGLLTLLARPTFWLFLLGAVGIAFVRFFELAQVWSLLPIGLLLLGYISGSVLMQTRHIWLACLFKIIPGAKVGDEDSIAALRSPIIFLALPILGILIFTSNSAALGLGAYWGVWAWYAQDSWSILQGNTEMNQQYFSAVSPESLGRIRNDQLYTAVLAGFLLFGAAWGLAIAFL